MPRMRIIKTTALAWGLQHRLSGMLRPSGGVGQSGQTQSHDDAGIHRQESRSAEAGRDSRAGEGDAQ